MDNTEIFRRYAMHLGRPPSKQEIDGFRDRIIDYTESMKALEDSLNATADITQVNLDENDVNLLLGEKSNNPYIHVEKRDFLPEKRTELSDRLGIALDEIERKNNHTLLSSILEDEGFSSQGYAFKRVRDGKARYLFMEGINNTAVPEGSYVFEVPLKETSLFEEKCSKTSYEYSRIISSEFGVIGATAGLIAGTILGVIKFYNGTLGNSDLLQFINFYGRMLGGGVLLGIAGLGIDCLALNILENKSKKEYDLSKFYLNQFLTAKSEKSYDSTVIRKALE